MRKVWTIGVLAVVALAVMAGTIMAQDSAVTGSAWLGVALVEVDGQVMIARVQAGSPANVASLLIGDVVVTADGTAVATASDLVKLVQAAAPGDVLSLELLRNGASVSADVTLGSASAALWGRFGRGQAAPFGGLTAAEMLLHADLEEAEAGFTVVSVFGMRNPFELQQGDIVTSINGQAVAEFDLQALLTDLAARDNPELSVSVVRDGAEVTLSSDGLFGVGRGMGRGFFDERGRGMGRGFDERGGRRGGFGPGFFMPPAAIPETAPEDAAPVNTSTGQV
jgi:membrane-associated protease RseP (regulator of RpoE activity)